MYSILSATQSSSWFLSKKCTLNNLHKFNLHTQMQKLPNQFSQPALCTVLYYAVVLWAKVIRHATMWHERIWCKILCVFRAYCIVLYWVMVVNNCHALRYCIFTNVLFKLFMYFNTDERPLRRKCFGCMYS